MKSVSPFAWQLSALELWQRQQAHVTALAMQSDAYRTWMKPCVESLCAWQEAFVGGSQAWLALFNLPTREELSRTIERTVDLEERLEQLSEEVKQAGAQEARIACLEHELAAVRSEIVALRTESARLAEALSRSPESSGRTPASDKADKSARSSSRSTKSARNKLSPPPEMTN